MCVNYDDPQANITTALSMIEKASGHDCKLILLPELWSTGFRLEYCQKFSTVNEDLLTELQFQASRHNIEIMGSYLTRNRDAFYNEFIALSPDSAANHYQKINLFPLLMEPDYFTPGERVQVFTSRIGLYSPSICYDLRFPWLYKEAAQKGAQFQIIPAHWPAVRIHHWDVLLQARAIETMSYVIAVNSAGKSGNVVFGGHSSVISPEGEIVFQADETSEDVFIVDIDPDLPATIRKKHPFFSDIQK